MDWTRCTDRPQVCRDCERAPRVHDSIVEQSGLCTHRSQEGHRNILAIGLPHERPLSREDFEAPGPRIVFIVFNWWS